MAELIYSVIASLAGYIEDAAGTFCSSCPSSWEAASAPSPTEVSR